MDTSRVHPAGDPRDEGVFAAYYPGHLDLARAAERRFWDRVDRSGGPEDCWTWLAGTFASGYGSFMVGSRLTGYRARRRAHRLAYEATFGPIPDDINVLHRCDNPPCCNSRHLWLGTHADNVADRVAKNRTKVRRGEEHPAARITAAQVRELRERYARGGISQSALAREVGLAHQTVSDIVRGRRRRTDGGPIASHPFAAAKAKLAHDQDERPCACYEGVVYLGRITLDVDSGEEEEIVEAVPCKRCGS